MPRDTHRGDREDLAIASPPCDSVDPFRLSDDHRMLLRIRDTLYEGSWADFIHDLRARAEGRPHVFELVPPSPRMKATIAAHLLMIEDMKAWEASRRRPLHPDERLADHAPSDPR